MNKFINLLIGGERARKVIKDGFDASICALVVCIIFFILQGKIDIGKLIAVEANVFVITLSYKSIKDMIIPDVRNNKNVALNIFAGISEALMSIFLVVITVKRFLY